MHFNHTPNNLQLAFALELNKLAVERGRNSFFDRWWFFDTNCVSELVKMHQSGFSAQVHTFLASKDILITSAIVQELRKAPDILQTLEAALQSANIYLVPDVLKFWYTDIVNFLNVDQIPINSLEVYPLQTGFFNELIQRREFEQACLQAERNVKSLFIEKVEPDVGADFDEKHLSVYIWSVVNKYGRQWFDIDIPPADCNSGNFPSFYVYFYAYYFRYVKNRTVKPDLNDFIDLVNCMVAPYCQKFYCEAKFANVLRLSVQGRKPPTAFQITKMTYKEGRINLSAYREAKRKKKILNRTAALLPNTEIFNFSDMRTQIQPSSTT